MITIRPMKINDVETVSMIHTKSFTRQLASKKWVICNLNAYPRIMMFVAINADDKVIGYIQWLQKSGFRKEAVIELEQIAVLPAMQGNKVGTTLITKSLALVKEYLIAQDAILKAIMVTTRSESTA